MENQANEVGVQTEVFHFATNLASELLVSLGGLVRGAAAREMRSLGSLPAL